MPESRSRHGYVAAALLVGALLALAGGFGSVAAALGVWLAQPAFALAVRWWRATGQAPARARARAGGRGLVALWRAGAGGAGALGLWAVAALGESGALRAAGAVRRA